MRGRAIAVITAAIWSSTLASHAATPTDDAYIRGYLAALAERDYQLPPSAIDVHDGVVNVNAPALPADARQRLTNTARSLPGVADVRFDGTPAAPAPPTTPLNAPPAVTTTPPQITDSVPAKPAAATAAKEEGIYVPGPDETYKLGLLPGKTIFDPLLADVRWPQFAATFRNFQNDRSSSFGDNVGAADFGGSLAIYRFQGPGANTLSEIGLQAAVFSQFDLDSDSHNLINADYFFSLYDSIRIDKFSLLARVLHQSSHLGDEYLLAQLAKDPSFQRINVSYEQVNLLASYDLTHSLRIYAGGGYLFDQDPGDMDPLSLQYGAEYKAPFTIAGHMRPVAAVDFQHRERENWDLNLSARAGVQFEGDELRGSRLLLLFEYYTGHDPNGQFYTQNIQWYGLGLHWFF